nr:glycerophosphodiester phosphodiesterase family protein [Brachybacterium muris]
MRAASAHPDPWGNRALGRPRFAPTNALLASRLNERSPLIAVHRGSGAGSIAENTAEAVKAALAQGADIVEIDVIASTDGDYFLFHNGYEAMHFGMDGDIRELSTAQMEELEYAWQSKADPPYGLARLDDVLRTFPGTILNIDRSWWYWETLLDHLATFGITDQLLLKAPVEEEALALLAAHPEPFPFLPIVKTPEELEQVLAMESVNTVAVELLAQSPSNPFADPECIRSLRERGIAVYLNALNLSNRVPLFCGWDDETSVLSHPDEGWGRLIALGADIVQTDWPALLRDYRDIG